MAEQYSDPYEEWKAQGRPGGSYSAWQNQQYGAPAVPAPAPQVQQQPASYGAPAPAAAPTSWDQAYQTFSANPDWKDTDLSNAQWEAWNQEEAARRASGGGAQGCPPDKPFTGRNGQCAYKPDDCPDGMVVQGSDTNGTARCVPIGGGGGGGGGDGTGGGGGGGGSWGAGTAGEAPGFTAPRFTTPSYEDMLNDPGYQARLKQQQTLLEHSQAARGMTRSGGSLADLAKFGQDYAANEYQNVYGRAANTYGLNYQAAKDEFAPQYGAWQTKYGGDLSRWTTGQNVDLSKWTTGQNINNAQYLNRENNLYGMISGFAPAPPQPWYGG